KEKGYAIVAPNYRLSPKVKSPVYIEDAAAAVAWVFNNISQLGGDSGLIFLSGSSAGGYLDMMVGLDKQYLDAHGIDANRIAGLIPFTGHTITHFTIRAERGIPDIRPIVDAFAPLYHVRPDAPPLLLITGDRELEMLGRYEENAYMMRMMKIAGHTQTRVYELDGYGHAMAEPALPLLLREVERIVRERTQSQSSNCYALRTTFRLPMNKEIQAYNDALADEDRMICDLLAKTINTHLPDAESKIWHAHPVWFLEGNPVVGYSKLKNCVRLLFWSGQSFGVEKLKDEGTFKAAE